MTWTPAILFAAGCAAIGFSAGAAPGATLDAPRSIPCFDAAEFTVTIANAPPANPFIDAELSGFFTAPGEPPIAVAGFCDSQDGSIFRLRFAPGRPAVSYGYELRWKDGGTDQRFTGVLRSDPSNRPGPVIVDPEHPKHFIFAGSRKPFYPLGYTAYHLLDPSNDAGQIDGTIAYCAENGFNRIRFLLTGYPRDTDERTSDDAEHGVEDPKRRPNYGAKPGQVNALPAWEGKPHAYDFTRFHVAHWQRVDAAVRNMRERGIAAVCIVTIEKQDLPREYGRLTPHELRLYRYAAARLAAFDNVWWDLGNEHNEYRDPGWGNAMGAVLNKADPFGRLASAHAYEEFPYATSAWADFIITQQYGDPSKVHAWALRHASIPKPYVNEEYGYEGEAAKPGHGQNGDIVRRCHWAIAMAGGYATYGDWSGGVSYYYMGEPGPGKAAKQLRHVRAFFEGLPFRELTPRDDLATAGFCLARPPAIVVFYLPDGGVSDLDLSSSSLEMPAGRWFDPRTGEWRDGPRLVRGKNTVTAPAGGDWALLVKGE